MEKEIQELTDYFIANSPFDVELCKEFARMTIEGGYANKKCFNADHVVFGKDIK